MAFSIVSRRLLHGAIATVLICARAMAQDSARVHVTIEGVEGPLKDNVELVLELARRADEGRIPVARIVQLHQRASTDIAIALQPFGYYQTTVHSTLERTGDDWAGHYQIDLGPAVTVHSVSVQITGAGGTSAEFAGAEARFPLQVGDTMQDVRYEAGKLALLTLASDSGYLDADFDTSAVLVDRGARSADITIRFYAGDRFRFGEVHFVQDDISDQLLRSRVPFHQGELFRQDKLLELQTALAADPYWERVEVTPQRDEAEGGEVPIEVVLIPYPAATYEVGLGYGTDTGPRGTLGAQLRRLSRAGLNARGDVVISPLEQSIKTELRIPAFGQPVRTLTLFGGYARLNPNESDSRALNAGARLDRHTTDWNQVLSLTYQHEAFEIGVDSGVAKLLMLGASWERTRSDDPVFPRHGIRTRVSASASNDRVLSSVSYWQAEASAKGIYAVSERTRLLGRIEVGYISTSHFRELPPTVRFFTGGDQSVRGFTYQGLGSMDSTGTVIGGQALRTASLEVDRRIFKQLGVALFTDVGNATQHFDLRGLEQSVGAGVRYLSPVGMIRIDGAFVISRDGNPFRLHLSIGPDL